MFLLIAPSLGPAARPAPRLARLLPWRREFGLRFSREMLRRPLEFTQHTALSFEKYLKRSGVLGNMGSVGSTLDNVMAESLFVSLETELLDRRS